MTNTSETTSSNNNTASPTDELVPFIAKKLSDKKAEQIVILDLKGITTLADYFIICNGVSDTHLKSLADEVAEKTRVEYAEKPWRQEGLDTRRWIVLDYVNIVVHIFKEDTREHYGLEKMWNDAKITHYSD